MLRVTPHPVVNWFLFCIVCIAYFAMPVAAQDITVPYGTAVNLVAYSNFGQPSGYSCGTNFGSTCYAGTGQPNGNINWTLDGAFAYSSYDTIDDDQETCPYYDDNYQEHDQPCDYFRDESGYSAVLSVGWHTVTASIPVSQDSYATFSTTWTINVTQPPTPVVSAVSPAVATEGANITISGSGFGATQGSSTVMVSGQAAAVTSWADTQIGAVVPTGAGDGSGDVIVTVNGASSTPTPNAVVKFPTTVSVAMAPTTSTSGQTVTANVTVSTSTSAIPKGSVVCTGGGVTAAPNPATLPNGSAHVSLTFSNLPTGTYQINCAFTGTAQWADSSGSATETVLAPLQNAIISLTSSSPTSAYGDYVTLLLTVSPPSGAPNPTGTVTLEIDGGAYQTFPINGAPITVRIASLGVGGHTLYVSYSGDQSFNPGNSANLTQTVTNGTAPCTP